MLLDLGAMYGPYIADGQYWRLFTAMFLHVGMMHLAFNCIGLFIFGQQVERFFGHYRFITIYVLAGLAGSVSSFVLNSVAVAAGASGAIFGVLGALVAYFVVHRDMLGEFGRQSLTGLLILAGVNLFIGLSMPGVDNFAHVGGFAAGFALALPLAPRYEPVFDLWGARVGLRDTNSVLKRWWVVPVAAAVLILGTVLGAGGGAQSPIAHLRQAEQHLDSGRHAQALDEVGKAISMEPTFAQSYMVKARIFADLGDYRSALSELGLAMRLGLDERDQEEAVRLMLEMRSRVR